MIDSRKIADLHPALQRAATELKRRLKEHGRNMGISSTYRDNAMQNLLYSYGRTMPNPNQNNKWITSTNARGGQSIHNYRLAFDIFNNVVDNMYPPAFMKLAGKIGMEMGLEWGGSWASFKDEPHFQFTNGLSLSQLQKGAKVPDSVRMKWENVQAAPKEDDEVVEKCSVRINGKSYTCDRILKNSSNFIELRDLEQAGFEVDYDAESKTPVINTPMCKAEKGQVKIDGEIYEFDRILKDGANFLKLRDFEQAGFFVTYDVEKKMPVVYTAGAKE